MPTVLRIGPHHEIERLVREHREALIKNYHEFPRH
jgi:hypothetical protein